MFKWISKQICQIRIYIYKYEKKKRSNSKDLGVEFFIIETMDILLREGGAATFYLVRFLRREAN